MFCRSHDFWSYTQSVMKAERSESERLIQERPASRLSVLRTSCMSDVLCLALAQAQEQDAVSLIDLYTALGGGWQP
jgi:hypothetical protein